MDGFVIATGCFCIAFAVFCHYKQKKDKEIQRKIEEERKSFLEELAIEKQARFERNKQLREAISEELKDCVEIEFEVKGIFARSKAARELVPCLDVTDEIKLRKEPSNPYDSNAVKVIAEGKHVGYIPRKASAFVTGLIDKKRIVRVICSYSSDGKVEAWDEPNPDMDIVIFYK